MIIVIFQFILFLMCIGFPRWLSGKESTYQCRRRGFDPWSRKIPWRRKWQPTPVFWPENPHGQRTLAGYSPWGRKKVRHDLATTKSIAWDSYGLIKNLFCSTATATAKSRQSCPTLCDPIDDRPTRLLRPWDSPGKNTGVGCHFLLQCMKVESESEVAQSCLTPSNPMDCSLPGSSIHGIVQARVLEGGAIAFSTFCSNTY